MANDHDKQIRLAAKAIIKNRYPTVQGFAWNALSHDIDEWAGMFKTSDNKIFGFIVKRAAVKSEWKNPQRDRRHPAYDIWIFYGFRAGAGVTENDNSDNEFGEILDCVYEDFKAAYNLNLPGVVEKHDLLQYAAITTIESGEETLHFAQGRLSVHLCC
jgi:hypothetical protein